MKDENSSTALEKDASFLRSYLFSSYKWVLYFLLIVLLMLLILDSISSSCLLFFTLSSLIFWISLWGFEHRGVNELLLSLWSQLTLTFLLFTLLRLRDGLISFSSKCFYECIAIGMIEKLPPFWVSTFLKTSLKWLWSPGVENSLTLQDYD
jgi:hypothetical protein